MALWGKAPKDRVVDEWRAAREWKPLVCLKKIQCQIVAFLPRNHLGFSVCASNLKEETLQNKTLERSCKKKK